MECKFCEENENYENFSNGFHVIYQIKPYELNLKNDLDLVIHVEQQCLIMSQSFKIYHDLYLLFIWSLYNKTTCPKAQDLRSRQCQTWSDICAESKALALLASDI